MIEILWWWAVFFLPLPWIIAKFYPKKQHREALVLPYVPQVLAGQDKKAHTGLKWLLWLIWLLIIGACMRPVWYGDPIDISMAIKDMRLENGEYVDRLTTVKAVLSDFIKKRQGDRIGLILFADHAYLQTPLTLDVQTVAKQLKRAQLGLIGSRTAIGEGIGLASKNFIKNKAKQRILILLSDGSNNSGVIDPLQAAQLAAKSQVKIYTVGVGAKAISSGSFFFSHQVNPSRDLDEKTLQEIAKLTGGRYFRATDPKQLVQIYDEINQLQPIKNATQRWRPQDEWFSYPLGAALLLWILFLLLRKHYDSF